MGKFQATPALRSDPESPQESRNLPKVRPSPRTPPPVGFSRRAGGSTESGSLRGASEDTNQDPDRARPPHASPASYVIALSQTDTVEQARWMHALDTRTADTGSALSQ
jgi:hypothetical protein